MSRVKYSFPNPKLSSWGRLLNGLSAVLPKKYPHIDAEVLLTRAQQATGLNVRPEPYFMEGLHRVIEAVREHSATHFGGRITFRNNMFNNLVRHLCILDYHRRKPGVARVPIVKPIFILGLPRSGTTLLQNLLCLDEKARTLRYWESLCPYPSPEPATFGSDPRIAQAKEMRRILLHFLPELPVMHHVDTRGPEECDLLFAYAFHAPHFFVTYGVPGYIEWLMSRDMGPAYAFYKKQLQIMDRNFPGRHRVLKAPMHLGFTPYLLATFPDASIVQTHRDPCEAVPSVCSLVFYIRKLATNRWRPREVGAQWSELLAQYLFKTMAFRQQNDGRFHDVAYRDLVADPIGTVKRIYARFGYRYSRRFERRMTDYLAENRQHKRGKHRYSRQQFGLSADGLHHTFERYYDEYASYL